MNVYRQIQRLITRALRARRLKRALDPERLKMLLELQKKRYVG